MMRVDGQVEESLAMRRRKRRIWGVSVRVGVDVEAVATVMVVGLKAL
jgi:hypothetical protein